MTNTLDGKVTQGLAVDNREILKLEGELEELCDVGGFHFHSIREARKLFKINKKVTALANLTKIEAKSEEDAGVCFRLGQMLLKQNDFAGVRKQIQHLRALPGRGENDHYANELEAQCLMAESRLQEAKDFIYSRFREFGHMQIRLNKELARAIGFSPRSASKALRDWAAMQ